MAARPGPPSLDDLAGDWPSPELEEEFSLPAIVNFRGLVQATRGPTGFQTWVQPPTGMATPTGTLFVRRSDCVRRFPPRYRWRAYEVEREASNRGLAVQSRLRLAEGRPVALERIRFQGTGTVYLAFGGLMRAWSFTDYWNLPPEDVPQLNARWDGRAVVLDDTKTFGIARLVPCRTPDAVHLFHNAAEMLERLEDGRPGRSGRAKLAVLDYWVKDGDELAFLAEQGTDADVMTLTAADLEGLWDGARTHWERVWRTTFTPGNPEFGGHLPWLECGDPELGRLYAISVLSLLNSRRIGPELTGRDRYATGGQAIWAQEARPLARAYTWGGSEGAVTTSFLWELQLQAPLLALLDPDVLREQLEAFLRMDVHAHWGLETVSGRGAGMWYGVNDGVILSAAHDYLRTTGNLGWLDREVAGRSVREHLLGAATHWRSLNSDEGGLADYGAAQNILECVSTYEHRVAAFNAMNAWGLRIAAYHRDPARAAELRADADRIASSVLALREPEGFYRCLQPDGTARSVRTVLDFIYVGRFLGEDLPREAREAMAGFVERELLTPDWLLALSPLDPDAFSGALPSFQSFRADHQATGGYDGWPGLVASVLLRFGGLEPTLEWLRRVAGVTREGPFGQAHYLSLTEADRARPARKASFYNGTCALEACGCTFATTLLEDVCGLDFSLGAPGEPRLRDTGVGLTCRLHAVKGRTLETGSAP